MKIIYSKVTEAPEEEPVDLETAKAWLKIDGDDEDAIVTLLIKVAREIGENYTGLSFATQTRTIKLDKFCGDIILPYGPVTAVESIEYVDSDGNEQPLDAELYTLDDQSSVARVRVIDSWPETDCSINNVVVTYTAGFADGEIPEAAKTGMLLQLTSLYENRQDEVIGSTGNMINHNSQAIWDTIKTEWSAYA